jgi:DnaK suppressor protein
MISGIPERIKICARGGRSRRCVPRALQSLCAAPHGNGLTWKNSGLNTGAHVVPLGSRRADTTPAGDWEAWMGKSNHGKAADRKAARKGRPQGALNGGAASAALNSKKTAIKAGKKARSQRSIVLPDGYRPSENEPFMNERHRVYFRNKLVVWKEEIIRQNRETLLILHEDSAQHADLADRATSETDRALELRARDRQRKLIAKIDAALARIEEGTYGYCEETGEPIGLKRLDARPIATLSLEAQERHERREKVFRED